MDFRNIDELVDKFQTGEHINNMIGDKLDLYDLERLRSIYSRVIGKKPDLLKRQHLCHEIINEYSIWALKNKKEGPEYETSDIFKIASLIATSDRSSFRRNHFVLGSSLDETDCLVFNCQSKLEFYQKCFDELLYRSKVFSQITTEHPEALKGKQYKQLLNLYFRHFYTGYLDYYLDYLLICTVGLNLFHFQIVNINFEKTNASVEIKYDLSTPRLGYLHLQLLNFPSEFDSARDETSLPTITNEELVSSSDDDEIVLNPKQNESFIYNENWIYFDALGYRFTMVSSKSQIDLMKDEVFSNLSKID